MIKVYVCKAKITTPFITRNKRIGFYKEGETFLMYLSPKGTWVTTTPLNSKTESDLITKNSLTFSLKDLSVKERFKGEQ